MKWDKSIVKVQQQTRTIPIPSTHVIAQTWFQLKFQLSNIQEPSATILHCWQRNYPTCSVLRDCPDPDFDPDPVRDRDPEHLSSGIGIGTGLYSAGRCQDRDWIFQYYHTLSTSYKNKREMCIQNMNKTFFTNAGDSEKENNNLFSLLLIFTVTSTIIVAKESWLF